MHIKLFVEAVTTWRTPDMFLVTNFVVISFFYASFFLNTQKKMVFHIFASQKINFFEDLRVVWSPQI